MQQLVQGVLEVVLGVDFNCCSRFDFGDLDRCSPGNHCIAVATCHQARGAMFEAHLLTVGPRAMAAGIAIAGVGVIPSAFCTVAASYRSLAAAATVGPDA